MHHALSRCNLLITAAAMTTALGASRFPTVAAPAAQPARLVVDRRTIEVDGRADSVFGIRQPDGVHGVLLGPDQPFSVSTVPLHDFSFRDTTEVLAAVSGPTKAPGRPAAMPGMVVTPATAGANLNDFDYDAYLANDRNLSDPLVARLISGIGSPDLVSQTTARRSHRKGTPAARVVSVQVSGPCETR